MCAGAIVLARIGTVVWGLDDPKRGGATTFNIFEHPGINHHPAVVRGVLEEECRDVLVSFFRQRRAGSKCKMENGKCKMDGEQGEGILADCGICGIMPTGQCKEKEEYGG